MNNLQIKKIKDISDKLRKNVDAFIMDAGTNGEFINTLNFLGYHPVDRFEDDSIIVVDENSNTIRGVMMACIVEDGKTVSSYMGTTYAGPIVSSKVDVDIIIATINTMLDYYKSRYSKIIIKPIPEAFSKQPSGIVDYIMLKNEFVQGISSLANVLNISSIKTLDDVLMLANSKRRNQIKKTIKESHFIVKKYDSIPCNVWNSVNANLAKRYNGHTVHTYEEINDLIFRCPQNIDVYIAENEVGEYGALAVIFKFKNVYHTQYLDLNYEMSATNPNLFLIYNLIYKAAEEGYKTFSFGGSTENAGLVINRGLFEYKSGYGGGTVLLPQYIWEMH